MYVTTLALKIRIWIFGFYYVHMLCVSGKAWELLREEKRKEEREGEGGRGGGEEGEREYKSLKHPHLQPPHPGGKCLLFQSFSCLTQSCKISNLPQNNVFVASYFYSVIEKASWYNMNISQALGG